MGGWSHSSTILNRDIKYGRAKEKRAPEPVWTLWSTWNLLLLPGIEPRPSSPSLYQLNYPGTLQPVVHTVTTLHTPATGHRPCAKENGKRQLQWWVMCDSKPWIENKRYRREWGPRVAGESVSLPLSQAWVTQASSTRKRERKKKNVFIIARTSSEPSWPILHYLAFGLWHLATTEMSNTITPVKRRGTHFQLVADILLEVRSGRRQAELNATYWWMVRDPTGRLSTRYVSHTHTHTHKNMMTYLNRSIIR
jgi:hypothetical protein